MPRLPALLVALLTAAVLVTAAAPAAPAQAATAAPRILVQRLDPLQSRPVVVQVAVLGQDGFTVPFRGTVTLTVARTSATTPVVGTGGSAAVARVDTTRLQDGVATLHAALTVAGRSRTLTLRWFVQVEASLHVTGFSCSAIPPGGAPIRWAVDRMNGDPVLTPNSRDVPLLPYVPSSTARWSMTGPDGTALATSGSVTILQGTRRVAVRPLARQVRRLVFGGTWDGRVGGAFRPGTYTARLLLVDALGGRAEAEQQVLVLPKGAVACGA